MHLERRAGDAGKGMGGDRHPPAAWLRWAPEAAGGFQKPGKGRECQMDVLARSRSCWNSPGRKRWGRSPPESTISTKVNWAPPQPAVLPSPQTSG